jgi:3-oxoacyl-[acyl-carrier protein] reductase
LSQELGPKGIRVNAVSPGPIYIEGGSWNMIKDHMTPLYDSTVKNIALGRMGTADEIAAQVALLASPRAAFTTGTNVVIDGGLTKRIQY